jgi:hypothetical protein
MQTPFLSQELMRRDHPENLPGTAERMIMKEVINKWDVAVRNGVNSFRLDFKLSSC